MVLRSTLVCHLRFVQLAGDPRIKNIVVGICGAFPTMGNRELNHAQIDSMPHAVFSATKRKRTPGRETARARPTPTPAELGESSKLRHLQETARRERASAPVISKTTQKL